MQFSRWIASQLSDLCYGCIHFLLNAGILSSVESVHVSCETIHNKVKSEARQVCVIILGEIWLKFKSPVLSDSSGEDRGQPGVCVCGTVEGKHAALSALQVNMALRSSKFKLFNSLGQIVVTGCEDGGRDVPHQIMWSRHMWCTYC